jgi:hypothetical protein
VTAALDGEPGHPELLAAWLTLLAWYTAQDEVAVGTATGPEASPRLVAVDLSGDPTYPELVETVRRELSSDNRAAGTATQHFPVRYDGERDDNAEPADLSPVELGLSWTRGTTAFTLELDYATDLFDRSTATAMLTDLRRLLPGLEAHPDLPTQEVAMEYVHQDDTGFTTEAVR